jgi:hypothetical protein
VVFLLRTVQLLLLALWLPVTMHCTLETLPTFSFLQSCCGTEDSAPVSQDCAADVCGEVESGDYRLEEHLAAAPDLPLLLACAPGAFRPEPAAGPAPDRFPTALAPPELPRLWRFAQRAALPPRAPSFRG